MRPWVLLLCLCLAACAGAPPVEAPQGPMFGARAQTLDNGLRVVVVEAHRAPVATHMLWLPAGAADEAPGAHGAAHVLEHLMFKGAGGLAPGEYSRRIRAMGGQDNAFTGQDYTAYFAAVPAEHLADVMRLDARRVANFSVPDREAKSEINVVREERRERTEGDPQGLFYEALMAALFPDHAYGRSTIGLQADLDVMDKARAQAFWAAHYRPGGAVLVVGGDVEADEVFALARSIYGPLDPGPAAPRAPLPQAAPPRPGIMLMRSDTVRQPLFARAWRAPSRSQEPETAHALEIAVQMLGGGPGGALYRRLVVEEGLATALDLSYDADARGAAVVHFTAWPAPGVTPHALARALDEAVRDFRARPRALAAAKTSLIAQATYAQDSLLGPAMAVGSVLTAGTPLPALEAWPQRIAAVRGAQVEDAVRAHLSGPQARFVTGALLPYSAAGKE